MLTIKRESAYADRARNYQIELDGKIIDEIKDGETKVLDIKPGEHTIKIKIDWTSSPSLEFKIKENENASFKCKSSLTGAKVLLAILYVVFAPHRYIDLEQIS